MVEGALNAAAELVLEATAYGNLLERDGNRSPNVAPQGLYVCRGDDQWLAISVVTDEQWRGLVRALGSPAWAADPALEDYAARRARHDELDDHLAQWCAERDPGEAAELLVAHGVPAGVGRDPRSMFDHPQLQRARLLRGDRPPGSGPSTHADAAVPVRVDRRLAAHPRRSWASTTTRSSSAISASTKPSTPRSRPRGSSATGRRVCENMGWKVVVNENRCEANAVCVGLAPEVFELPDDAATARRPGRRARRRAPRPGRVRGEQLPPRRDHHRRRPLTIEPASTTVPIRRSADAGCVWRGRAISIGLRPTIEASALGGMVTTTELHWPEEIPITPDDDQWHDHSQHWWETETTWWSFNVPERKMGGWLYTQVLAVQGTCNGGAWVWDDSDAGALYEVRHQGLPFPDRGDLRHATFPNGNTVEVLEPLMKYRTTYSDPGRFEADLVHEGIMPPHSHPVGAWPFWATRHFDQPMHVTGTLVLSGEEIAVDCFSVRDRSWGPRPAGPDAAGEEAAARVRCPAVRTGRCAPTSRTRWATCSARRTNATAFLAFTDPVVEGERRSHRRPRRRLPAPGRRVRAARRRRPARLSSRRPPSSSARIRLEATDALGRELSATGEMVSHHGEQGPSGTGLFHWEWTGGCRGWGEDQTFAPPGWLEALDTAT